MVPLEDGDRCEALVAMGKTVIVIDLNPLSRSARRGSITIVDELSRCLENMLSMSTEGLPSLESYDHNKSLQDALDAIVEGMKKDFLNQRNECFEISLGRLQRPSTPRVLHE